MVVNSKEEGSPGGQEEKFGDVPPKSMTDSE